MSTDHITITFEGLNVEDGLIDVNDLAAALLSFSDLIQAANRSINGLESKMSVHAQATSKGSFNIDLSIIQTLVDRALNLLDFTQGEKDRISNAKDLTELLFKWVGTAGIGLFYLMKLLKNKPPEQVKSLPNNQTEITINGNIHLVDNRVINLAQDPNVRIPMQKLVKTLEKEGLEKIVFKRKEQESFIINKEEISYYTIPEHEEKEQELEETERRALLQIISLSFKESNKWKVTEGLDPFHVTIEDAVFLNKIANNEISFAKSDYLDCLIRERKFLTAKGDLKKETTIVEVIEHKIGGRQLNLL